MCIIFLHTATFTRTQRKLSAFIDISVDNHAHRRSMALGN